MSGTILIVEDNPGTRFFLSRALKDTGYKVLEADRGKRALEIVTEENVDLIILDLRLPDCSGLELMPKFLGQDPDLPIVVLTAHGEVPDAVQAMKLRASDFIVKPPDLNVLRQTIAQLLRNSSVQKEILRLRSDSADKGAPFVPGKSRKMARILEMVERIAPTPASVLLTGETGTGKERFASLIHSKSDKANKSFIAINCSAVPEHLIESELFGSVKGAFTGATSRKGLIEEAHGGTLFLDEISAMKPDMQVKLLRVLEERVVRRVGATSGTEVDIRLIAASNRNLKAMIDQGTFREDLYYRIAVFSIELPPLRERQQDIAIIAAAYINYYNRVNGKFVEGLTPEALACLEKYTWPGNVRELRNAIESAVILTEGSHIGLEHLPPQVTMHVSACSDETPKVKTPLDGSLPEMERRIINDALERCGGDLAATADLLGISEQELRLRMEAF